MISNKITHERAFMINKVKTSIWIVHMTWYTYILLADPILDGHQNFSINCTSVISTCIAHTEYRPFIPCSNLVKMSCEADQGNEKAVRSFQPRSKSVRINQRAILLLLASTHDALQIFTFLLFSAFTRANLQAS